MKNVWTLTVETSLPDVCFSEDDLVLTTEAFEKFDEAKKRLREILKEFAFSKNAIFDGNGYLTNFNTFIEERQDVESQDVWEFGNGENDDTDWLSSFVMNKIHNTLHEIFMGNDTTLSLLHLQYSDMYMYADVSGDSIKIKGWQEGPINGIDPFIETNMLDMTQEKDYKLCIDDYFGGHWDQKASSELNIYLRKTQLS